jgi:uncharacterized cupredoxin-like copper-binding protein
MRTRSSNAAAGRVPRLVVVVVGAAAVLLGACGSGEDRAGLRVEGNEMAFSAPSETVAGDYAVTFANTGKVAHELAIKDPSGKVVTRRSIAAGAQVVLDVTLTPGSWELACHEPGHYEAGMVRPLEVRAADA